VIWVAEYSPRELTSSRISFDSLSLPYLIRSQVSIILKDVRLPDPSSFWWAPTSPLLLAFDYPKAGLIILPIVIIKESLGYMPCTGVSQQPMGLAMWPHMLPRARKASPSLPTLPWRSLSSVLSITVGGGELSRLHAG
jgi:hypothetical protein